MYSPRPQTLVCSSNKRQSHQRMSEVLTIQGAAHKHRGSGCIDARTDYGRDL